MTTLAGLKRVHEVYGDEEPVTAYNIRNLRVGLLERARAHAVLAGYTLETAMNELIEWGLLQADAQRRAARKAKRTA